MKQISNIIAIMLCLSCIACKVDFDFSELDGQPILCIDSELIYEGGLYEEGRVLEAPPATLEAFIYGVAPAAGERQFPEGLECTMNVYHNSVLVWRDNHISLDTFAGSIYATLYGISPGDEITVTAEAEGFPMASSSVTVPYAPPVPEISHERINADTFRISITIEDDPETEDCYAFTFTKAALYDSSPNPTNVGYLDLSFGNSEDTPYLDIGPFDVVWVDGEKFFGISDKEFEGRKKTFEINAIYKMLSRDYYKHACYMIGVYRMNPARLRYEIAQNDKSNNVLGFMGLAPVTFAYTNITGGTGCLSCSNLYETDWIPVPEPLEIPQTPDSPEGYYGQDK